MIFSEEEDLKILDDFFITKNFLFIFSLKRPACFFLWLYTIFFGFFVTHTAIDLFEAGFNFSSIASYIGFKWILSIFCFIICLTSLSYQRAIRGAFGCIYFFTMLCLFRVLLKICTIRELISVLKLPYIYLDVMYDSFKSVENRSMKYFCYFVFTITVALGWHISMVIFSYHRETWIPINPALEGNVADLHIESITAPKPANTGDSNRKKKKANKRRGRRR